MKRGARGAVLHLNSKTSLYCGFTILRLPRKKPYNRQRYQITHTGHYYGIDFALLEACRTIDRIMSKKCFIAF
ncbi:DUF4761 domain-containing protein [Klebsiella grimontii]|uniref:DUF4761 domain-containing protein n=1 Tax=Klebsiella grimontii TaxID=2058152 RepID=UPI0012B840F0|nr:DUF4761 domain-containing protein [Klebsiella grimontii]MDV0332063.1 DUF4761 domain-containing protein [Klebsiella grimontii]MDV0376268.1 DUF4761 domain-containing protein [Klebsiella grimontii]MDV0385872.1 DUF4761 domain-containing protein [Klebsiella grimontii]MDV0409322.1 DUF4761 domain-containing protein [Klebsiella grimontii]MDV0419821.1 DUF4761 domain-containing protein [Klebsiella grimontii]